MEQEDWASNSMTKRLRIGVLYSRVRVEEKWIFASIERRGLDYERLDDRLVHFDLENPEPGGSTMPSWNAASVTPMVCTPAASSISGHPDRQHGRGGGGLRR